jgi:CTP synthase (UTP-ammonia lyase)
LVPANERRWIAVIGDRIADFEPHDAIESAVEHSARPLDIEAPEVRWFPTDELEADAGISLSGAAAVWCAPGGPFQSMEGALGGIRWARTHDIPFIGTCAGFQHAVVEFARSVLGHRTAGHAEYGESGELFIDELLCSLVGQTMEVDIVDAELARMYGTTTPTEKYYCRFGVNPRWLSELHDGGLRIAGVDARDGDVRIMRLDGHPFYVLTLFVPQASSTVAQPHPLITSFLSAALLAKGAA